jgi:signal peptidase I
MKDSIKKAWHWIWHSDSILSWFVALIIIFVFVKYIFFPVLGFAFASELPLAGVESSSMEHQLTSQGSQFSLCGKSFQQKNYITFNEYWSTCGEWYENRDISKEKFESFPLHSGFSKGDILMVLGWIEPKVGDIIVFKPNPESSAPRPIVHRIVSIENEVIQTKGDHNEAQLTIQHNILRTDETAISYDQVIGTVVLRIPALGWIKIWILDFTRLVF